MVLNDILLNENIEPTKLEKGLKYIGHSLSNFNDVNDEQIPLLIELFKVAVNIDPINTTKFTKIDTRLKLNKILKEQSIIADYKVDKHESILELNNKTFSRHIKLGKVKFFDTIKGFGYVYSFTDNKDCFIHESKLITSGIEKDDIVIFETIESRKKPGELEAIQVSNKVPVFIFNKEFSINSFVYPLLVTCLGCEFLLTEKFKTGFATVIAKYKSSSWRISVLAKENIHKTELISFAKTLSVKLLSSVRECEESLKWLIFFLQEENEEGEINLIFSDFVNNLEKKTIFEINKEIKSIKDISFFNVNLKKKKKKTK